MAFKGGKGSKKMGKKFLVKALIVVFVLFAIIGLWFHHELTRLPPTPAVFVAGRDSTMEESAFFNITTVKYGTSAVVKSLEVINQTVKMGVSTDPNEINWGVVPKGVFVGKTMNLGNTRPTDAKVNIAVHGDIKPFVSVVGGDTFILKSGESKSVELLFNASEIGEYVGEIDVYIRIPKNWLVKSFLDLA
ncbi:MAG: hypothetical protein JXB14_05615 [Candidatus Altiarchaeota archaeon]|nr:hypothetical protein [Candidatus Altiarchaeota archaeon]